MGAGVSLFLSREGDHGAGIFSSIFSLIFDPFPREHGFYVGFVPSSREQVYYGNSSVLREQVSLCERNSSGGFKLPDTENTPMGAVMMLPGKASSGLSKKGLLCVLVEDAAFTGSGLSSKGQFSVLVEVVGTDDEQVTGKAKCSGVSFPQKGGTDNGFLIPSSSRSTATTGAESEVAGVVTATFKYRSSSSSSNHRCQVQGQVHGVVIHLAGHDLQGVEIPISDLLRSDGGYDQIGAGTVLPSGVARGSWVGKAVTADAITAKTVSTDSDSGVLLILRSAEGVLGSVVADYGVPEAKDAYNVDSGHFSPDLIVYGIRPKCRSVMVSVSVAVDPGFRVIDDDSGFPKWTDEVLHIVSSHSANLCEIVRSALDQTGYGGSGSRDLKYVNADRFFSDRTENDIGLRFSVSVSVILVLDSGWVNMPVCTQGRDCDVRSRFLSEGVDLNMFSLGQLVFHCR